MAIERSRWWCAALLVAGVAAGCSAKGRGAAVGTAEVTATRQALTSVEGLGSSGLSASGLWQSGLWTNGLWPNGIWQDGLWANGSWANGLWQHGLWQNGIWQDGLWANGVWTNGLPGDRLRSSSNARQLLQRLYSCAMPATPDYDTTIDPNSGTLTCSPMGCDAGYECSSQGTCVVPLKGAIGLGINADGTTWWGSGTCDESCQRWVSACVLARTNASGLPLAISMRAPADAPQAIKDALAVSGAERNGGAAFSIREGAYYGNIFATTPVAAAPVGGNGPATGPIAQTPTFYACAGPGSSTPEIAGRFSSSQGAPSVVKVPGVCLTRPSEPGACVGEDADPASPTFGAIRDCYTTTAQTGTPYNQVITVYLKQPVPVCGNAVCEGPTEDETSCPSDCHPGTWARDIAPDVGFDIVDASVGHQAFAPTLSVVAPDDTIVVAGNSQTDVDLGTGALPASQGWGVLAKYDSDGALLWGIRVGTNPTDSFFQVRAVTVAPNGTITVVGNTTHSNALLPKTIWIGTYTAGGAPTGPLSLPLGPVNPLGDMPPTPLAVASDPQGDIVMAGIYVGTVTFATTNGPKTLTSIATSNGSSTTNGYDIFVTKVSPQGLVLWADTYAGFGVNFPSSLVLDSSNDIELLSWERFTGGPDGGNVLRKLSQDGTVLTIREMPSSLNVVVAAVDASDNVYAAGGFNDYTVAQPFVGGPTINPLQGQPPFIVKYDSNGTFKWVKYAAFECPANVPSCSPGWIVGSAIGFDLAGNVILGSSGAQGIGVGVNFEAATSPPIPTYAPTSIFLSSYAPGDGQVQWSKQIPATLSSTLLGMALDSVGHVVVSGNYSESIQVDDRFLMTSVPEDASVLDSFVASFAEPSLLDTTPPIIGSVPNDIFAEATSPAGAVVYFMPPTASDAGNAGTSVVCSPPPNTTFPVGTTLVTCVASDPLGNRSTATFTVTVTNSRGPVFSPVADITVAATSPSGAVVTYTKPTATDQVDGPAPVSCTPLSGTAFGIGKTTVTCTASDDAGELPHNQSHTTFVVNVTWALGSPCASTAECTLGTCVDGVCCGSEVCGSCRSCNVPGSAGTCAVVAVGAADPSGLCQDHGAATCDTNGLCDGAGGCQTYADGTVCATASCPAGSGSLSAGSCQAGVCAVATQSCVPFLCGGAGACLTSCNSNADCASGLRCSGGDCIAKSGPGVVCAAGDECASGNCVDKVCCGSASCGSCQACNVAGNAGTCTPVAAGSTDPRGICVDQHAKSCGTTGICDGSGGCQTYAIGTTCYTRKDFCDSLDETEICAGGGAACPTPPSWPSGGCKPMSAGTNVVVDLLGGQGAQGGISLTFQGTIAPAPDQEISAHTPPSDQSCPSPSGFEVLSSGVTPQYWDIEASPPWTASPTKVCIQYDPTGLAVADECQLQLKHADNKNSCAWQTISSNGAVCASNGKQCTLTGQPGTGPCNAGQHASTICGISDHMSPFAIVRPLASSFPVIKTPGDLVVSATDSGGAVVSYSVSATDAKDGALVPACTPASGSKFVPGSTTVSCVVMDSLQVSASASFTVQVHYQAPTDGSFFLQPINPDGSSIFKAGSTIPVKFQLQGASAGISSLVAHLLVARVSSGVTGTYLEATASGNADTGNVFRLDGAAGHYIYNLSTKGMASGTWSFRADLGDGVDHSVLVSLR